MARILGLSCFYHDSAACLVQDGEIVAAAQEERFSRIKHDASFPAQAMAYCLSIGGLAIEDLDSVVFYEKPILKFDRLLASWLSIAPLGFRAFHAALPNWLKEKLFHPRLIRKELGGDYKKAILFCGHHESHAASAFYPSPFEEAAILTIDGVGEWETATIGIGRGKEIEMLQSLHFPHSLGLLYSAFTYYLGFRVNSGEYKVMGLAPYGKPVFMELILEKLVYLKKDGSFSLEMAYFNYLSGLTMTSQAFHDLFDRPPRNPSEPLSNLDLNLAASIQAVAEEIVLRMASTARKLTGLDHLCLAGGVALNSVANGKLLKSGIFNRVWVQPAAGDAGGALGAALRVDLDLFSSERRVDGTDKMKGTLLGESYSDVEISEFLSKEEATFERIEDESVLIDRTIKALDQGMVVGWFQGRMEYGPRALGNRSILADPRNQSMQETLNRKIKFRESFRPFAPAVLAEKASDYFSLKTDSPYMLFVDQLQREWLLPGSEEDNSEEGERRIRSKLYRRRSKLPAITHVDNSARIQTVSPDTNPLFHRLLSAWDAFTNCAVLVNTSFNIRGEPIVRTPKDAWNCFCATEMDLLVMGNHFILKSDNPVGSNDAIQYRKSYPLD